MSNISPTGNSSNYDPFCHLQRKLDHEMYCCDSICTRKIHCNSICSHVYLRDDMPFKVHSMFINLYQLKATRGAEESVTIATLVPEEDTLNSCTRSCTKFLIKLKFLDPITALLGMTTVRCNRGGKWNSNR